MRRTSRKAGLLGAWVAAAALALSACGSGGSIDDETKENEAAAGKGDCGDFNIAVNPWVGYEADAYVVGNVAKNELGCTVNYKELKEDVSWQGFGTGEVDVVLEDWGHPDLEKKFFAESGDGSAEDLGPTGNVGHHPLVRPAVAGQGAPGHPRLQEPEQVRRGVQDLGVGRQGLVPRCGPVLRAVRRGDHQQPRPELQGDLLGLRGGEHRGLREGARRTRNG